MCPTVGRSVKDGNLRVRSGLWKGFEGFEFRFVSYIHTRRATKQRISAKWLRSFTWKGALSSWGQPPIPFFIRTVDETTILKYPKNPSNKTALTILDLEAQILTTIEAHSDIVGVSVIVLKLLCKAFLTVLTMIISHLSSNLVES